MRLNLKTLILLVGLTLGSVNTFAIDPLTAINHANPEIVQWKKVGLCPFGIRINHWIPVAWVETSPTGDSYINGVSSKSNTSLLRGAGLESSSASRVFNFTTPLWLTSNNALAHGGMVCSIEDAHAGGGMEEQSVSGDCSNAGVINAAMSRIDSVISANLLGLMTLAYESSEDSGWLSGCRDAKRVNEAVAANVRCDTALLANELQIGGEEGRRLAASNCIGGWGSLYPRQAREIGATGAIAGAKTAYRALSTARGHLGRLAYPVDRNGRMQQSKPSISAGFIPGAKPLPANAIISPDRKYGWIYWRNVTCCVN